MLTPERFRELLLDHLYDLLDGADAQAMREYLDAQPAAQAEAARVRALLAAAAREEFPLLSFQAPASETAPASVTAAPPEPQRISMRRYWLRWAIAAGLILGLAAATPPTLRHVAGYYREKDEVQLALAAKERVERERRELIAAHDADIRASSAKVQETQDDLVKAQQDLQQEWQTAAKQAAEKQLYMIVTGPPAIQPGAPNRFEITTWHRQAQGVHAAARLNVKVRDQAGNVVFEEKDAHTPGEYAVVLPPDLAYKPETQLSFEVSAVAESGPRAEVTEKLSWSAPRYVTHLATDKPMYQPGQRVFFRSLTLNRATLQAPDEDFTVTFTILAPSGAVVWSQTGETRLLLPAATDRQARILLGPDNKPVRGIGVADFLLPEGVEGGEYTLTVRELSNRFPEEKRKFLVNKYTPDRLNKELEFTRKSYGPGDAVEAVCKVSLAEGGPLVGAQPLVFAQVDSAQIPAQALGRTDATGAVRIQAFLPKIMDRGKASLSVTFNDGGNQETILRPIPIVLKKLFVEYFPEGGDLIAGVPNRVYYEVKTPQDKPGELKARVVDGKGETVATTETLHDDHEPGANQGMGLFSFTPKAGESYSLKIDQPADVVAVGKFPPVKADGIALMVPTGVTKVDEPIKVVVHATGAARELLVGAYCRGRLLDHKRVRTQPGQPASVELAPQDGTGGVVRVTAFEEKSNDGSRREFVPRAERLAYRRPSKKIQLNIQPDKARYAPGESVQLTVSATDEQGKPARAIMMMSVVNQTVVTMADIKTDRAMPTHFAFVGEVRRPEDLEHADFLLNETNPKAADALDLLLGVQGWRRFAEQNPDEFRKRNASEAERVLVMMGQSGRQALDTRFAREQELANLYKVKLKDLNEQLRVAIEQKTESDARNADFPAKLAEQSRIVGDHTQAYMAAKTRLAPYEDLHRDVRRWALPILAGVALVVALACVAVALRRSLAQAVPQYATAAVSVVVGCLLIAAAIILGEPFAPDADGKVTTVANAVAPAGPVATPADALAIAKGPAPARDEARPDGAKFAAPMERAAMPAARIAPAAAPAPPPPAPAAPRLAGRPEGAPAAMRMMEQAKDEPMAKGDREAEGQARRNAMLNREGGMRAKGLAAGKPAGQQMADKKGVGMRQAGGDMRRAMGPGRGGNEEFAKMMPAMPPGAGGMPGMAGGFPGGGPGQPVPRGLGIGGGGLGGGGLGGGGFGGGFRGGFGGPGGPMPGMPFPGGGGRGLAEGAGPGFMMQPPAEPFIVREYRHVADPEAVAHERQGNAVETVLWEPVVVVPEDGKATVKFSVADAITRYRVLVAGNTLDGRLGSQSLQIEVRKPFSVEAKLPVEVTSSDKLDIPVIVVNDTDGERAAKISLTPTGFEPRSGSLEESLTLKPNQRSRRVFRLQPALLDGVAALKIEGRSEPFAPDGKALSIPVVPDGFPVSGAVSDLLEKVAEQSITLPDGYVKGTVKLKAQIFPTTLADLQKGLEGLLREPGGCFEQTSTSNYPNTLILQYLKESNQSNPEATQRASELLERGYQRLTSFECQKPTNDGREGYEWFGGAAPPHEALSAYGLLQFKDMAQVSAVDEEMVRRTRNYLLSRRKPDGSFERNQRALDTFGRAPQHITDAYIVWSLSETGKEDLTREINHLLETQKNSQDPYFLALVANALLNRDRHNEALELLKRVRDKQAADGGLDATETSITHSGGRDLRIETTALATLAWLKANQPKEFAVAVDKAVRWIGQQRGGYGGFGSTQSTILALKALIAHTKVSKRPAEAGTLKMYINGKLAGFADFKPEDTGTISIDLKDAEAWLKPGKNDVRLTLSTQRSFPFTLGWSYQTLVPASDPKCAVKLSTSLNKTKVQEGDTVRLTAVLENLGGKDKGQPMTVAIIGLPAGLKVPEDMKQLKDLAALRKTGPNGELESGEISFFEIRGRELVLYWRDLKPEAKIEVNLDLIANIPGEFRGPASRAYLYYNADHKHWIKPLELTIEAAVE